MSAFVKYGHEPEQGGRHAPAAESAAPRPERVMASGLWAAGHPTTGTCATPAGLRLGGLFGGNEMPRMSEPDDEKDTRLPEAIASNLVEALAKLQESACFEPYAGPQS